MLKFWQGALTALWIAALSLGGATASAQSDAGPVPPGIKEWPASGRITYDVFYGENGLKIGEAQHHWQHDGQRYSMETRLETTGMAEALYDFSYVQHSEGRVLTDMLQPTLFRVEQSGKPDQSAVFDWQKGKVTVSRKGRESEADIRPGDQDILSVWHLLGTHGIRGTTMKLDLVTSRRVTPSTIQVVGNETLTLPLGTMNTLHVNLRADNGKMSIDMWLARDYYLLPARILIVDDKGKVFDQRATASSFGESAPSAQ